MGQSSDSMYDAIYMKNGKAKPIDPKEALIKRDIKKEIGYTLYCKNYFKSKCYAKLKVVNRKEGFFSLLPGEEHALDCGYSTPYIPLRERIKGKSREEKTVIKIDNSDIFSPIKQGVSNFGSDEKKNHNYRSGLKNTLRKPTVGINVEYIRFVTDFVEFLNCSNREVINYVKSQLKANNQYYSIDDYNKAWTDMASGNTFLVEGFLDIRDIGTLENKGYVYLYPTANKQKDTKRIMLVQRGNGKSGFERTLKFLLNWIKDRNKESRKMAIVKGSFLGNYKDSNIIRVLVKDIDIKYRIYEYEPKTSNIKNDPSKIIVRNDNKTFDNKKSKATFVVENKENDNKDNMKNETYEISNTPVDLQPKKTGGWKDQEGILFESYEKEQKEQPLSKESKSELKGKQDNIFKKILSLFKKR
ncbi:hypothetical protein [Bacillus amyloliquefaciens]|nr:hypothetical protein [Bacillus amyloliquefaciens]QZY33943.1 hypothetical protein BAJP3144_06030 [Bacillus amyloliquefaciens]